MIWLIVSWLLVLIWFSAVVYIVYRDVNARIWRGRCRERYPEIDDGLYICRLPPGHPDRHYARYRRRGVTTELWWKEGSHE